MSAKCSLHLAGIPTLPWCTLCKHPLGSLFRCWRSNHLRSGCMPSTRGLFPAVGVWYPASCAYDNICYSGIIWGFSCYVVFPFLGSLQLLVRCLPQSGTECGHFREWWTFTLFYWLIRALARPISCYFSASSSSCTCTTFSDGLTLYVAIFVRPPPRVVVLLNPEILKAKIYEISSNTHQLHHIPIYHFTI